MTRRYACILGLICTTILVITACASPADEVDDSDVTWRLENFSSESYEDLSPQVAAYFGTSNDLGDYTPNCYNTEFSNQRWTADEGIVAASVGFGVSSFPDRFELDESNSESVADAEGWEIARWTAASDGTVFEFGLIAGPRFLTITIEQDAGVSVDPVAALALAETIREVVHFVGE